MAQLPQPFDANEVDPNQGGGGQLPLGRHTVTIIESSIEALNSGNGGKLCFKLQNTEGLTGYYNLNLFHQTSEQAVNIAKAQLSALSHVIGVFKVTDSTQLHGIPFQVEMGPRKDDPEKLEVKKGDKVLFGKYAGTEIKIEGVEHLIMREDDIIAIVE